MVDVLHYVRFTLPDQTGYSIRTAAIAAAQRRRGLDVAVAVHTSADAGRTGLPERIEVEGVPHLRAPARLARPRLFRHPRAPVDDYAAYLQEALGGPPAVVHAHSPGMLMDDAARLARRWGSQLVYEVRGFWGGDWRIERAAARRADRVL